MDLNREHLETKRRLWGVLIVLDAVFIAVCAGALGWGLWHRTRQTPFSEAKNAAPPLAEEAPVEAAEEAAPEPAPEPAAEEPAPEPAPEEPAAAKEPVPLKDVKTVQRDDSEDGRRRASAVTFEYEGPARRVELAASFYGYRPKKLQRRGDSWRLKVFLYPGTYRYRFLVDGKQRHDPRNPLKEGLNSLLVVHD